MATLLWILKKGEERERKKCIPEHTKTNEKPEHRLKLMIHFRYEEKSELRSLPGLGIQEFICTFKELIQALTKKLLIWVTTIGKCNFQLNKLQKK
ncbi:hypothetical protein AVEN_20305-1 [Araneus ventricosus]|uniref:Uncharacterized protein n=1 Tax=Araneus ventricosus TaxID=182803 RepID=A0A4Y2IAJ2_ARAVE|nr:hypothetical protein AVEN_20305-1 [Araneus ventricosus]